MRRVNLLLLPLLLLPLLAHYSHASQFTFPTIKQQVVEVWSDYYFITNNDYTEIPPTPVYITVSPNTMDISHPVLWFGNTTLENSFRIRPQEVNQYTITFEVGNDEDNIGVSNVKSVNRTISIEGLSGLQLTQGFPSEPLQMRLSYPSIDDLTVIPTSNPPGVYFEPSTIVIPEGAIAVPFQIIANDIDYYEVTYQVTGYESDLYATIPTSIIDNVYAREIYIGTLSSYALVGSNSSSFYVYTPITPNDTVTITPNAVDTTFFPSSVSFSSSQHIASFSYISTSPAYGARTVNLDISGPGATDYEVFSQGSAGLDRKPINVQPPSDFVYNQKTYISVRIGAPAANGVSVYLYAGNLDLFPNNVTFSGNTTSVVIEVWPTAIGNDLISFKVDGNDKDLYSTPTAISLTVVGGGFLSPNSWYVPFLWVGIQSPKIPVRASVKPDTNVVLIPQAPDLVFNPPKLQFTPSNLEQSFTITPAYTNKDANDTTVTTTQITFIVDGADQASFVAPTPVSVTVQRRSLQFVFSAHVTETTAGYKDLFLNKSYEFWATALYAPPTDLTVIPTNPYLTFEPSDLQFSSSVLHIKVIATVVAVAGLSKIDWIVGGKCGGLYTSPASQGVNLQLRPLALYQAMIAPDDRVYPGVVLPTYYGEQLSPYLGSNHVYWFNIRSNVIPDKSVTVTPRSNHIIFKPASFELSYSTALLNLTTYAQTTTYAYFLVPDLYVVTCNFSVQAEAPGVHEVWFELSGDDAPYYNIPANMWVMSTQELRLASEMSSATVISKSCSLVVLFAIVLFMLI